MNKIKSKHHEIKKKREKYLIEMKDSIWRPFSFTHPSSFILYPFPFGDIYV